MPRQIAATIAGKISPVGVTCKPDKVRAAIELFKRAYEIFPDMVAVNQIGLACEMTSLVNRPSRAVMERIGMVNSAEDFDHPALPEGSDLRRHCLYKINRAQWERDAA